jgi:hypothetical protein
LTYHTQKGIKVLNIMRATVAASLIVFATIGGFAVGEPTLGLFALFAAIMFLKADWGRN